MAHNGVERNYRIVGLTEHNTALVQIDGCPPHDSHEGPSEVWVSWLSPREKSILRRGMTRGGRDRRRPRAARVQKGQLAMEWP